MIDVYLNGQCLIKNHTPEQLVKIKEDLTFPNPDFETAKRHSKFGTGNIPPYVNYYTVGREGILVPRGYKIPFPYRIVEDKRVVNNVDYPPLSVPLRETQAEAVDAFLEKYKTEKAEHGVIILPTGKGKSILGLYLARKMSQRVLVIVQKDDLVDGWTKDAHFLLGLRPNQVGLIKAQAYRIGKQVTVTTIQTLSKLPPEKLRELHKIFGMIIVDEFHHSVAKIYSLVEYFPARFKIGLTATAMRNDGLQDVLYLHFGSLVYEYQDQANDEDILPANIIIRNAPTVFEPERKKIYNPRKKRPEYESIPISTIRKATSFDPAFNTMLAKDVINEYNEGKSCVVFTHEKEHCRVIEQYLIERGVPEEHIQLYYGDAKTSKEVMKERAEKREVLITIATYSIATEGTNVKAWERGFLASTVANEISTVQAIGRVRRTAEGKLDCVVYDYRFPKVIIAKNHGAIRDKVYKERGYNVEGRESKGKSSKSTGRGWGAFRG